MALNNGTETGVVADNMATGADADADRESSDANAKSETPYPYHDLREAERVAVAVTEAGGTEASEDDVLAKLKLASKTSRSYTYRLSSAKEFGLVSKSGRGDSARITLTPLGRRLQMPESPAEVQAARVAAFLTPALYQQLARRYGGMPLPDAKGLSNVLARDFKVLASVAQIAAEAFLESARHAGWVTGNGRLQIAAENQTAAPVAPAAAAQTPPRDAGDTTDTEGKDSKVQTIRVPADFIIYKCKISGGRVLEIPLPHDFSKKDVDRLTAFLETQIDDEETSA